jgi:DNA-binding beta-propeller fold protein YncE
MRAVGEVRVGREPAAVATAGDAVWVTNTDDGTVSLIDATP